MQYHYVIVLGMRRGVGVMHLHLQHVISCLSVKTGSFIHVALEIDGNEE